MGDVYEVRCPDQTEHPVFFAEGKYRDLWHERWKLYPCECFTYSAFGSYVDSVCMSLYICMYVPTSIFPEEQGWNRSALQQIFLVTFQGICLKKHGESLRGNSALLSTTVEGIIARLLTCWKGRGKWMTLSTGRSERSSWKGGEKHSHMKWSEWVYLDHLILKKTFFISFTLLAFPKLFLIPYCKSEVSY